MRSKSFILPVLFISILVINVVNQFLIKLPTEEGIFSQEITGALLDFQISQENQEFVPVIYDKNYAQTVMRWGLRRAEGGKTPYADPGTPELIGKYRGRYLGDTSKNKVYLTFDEGYEAGYTSKILDTLREQNVKAIFFVTGPYLKEQEVLIRRMVEEGHEVGNHTVNHPSLPLLEDQKMKEEMLQLDQMFFEKHKKHMRFFRAPKGEYNERVLAQVQSVGYTNLFWSLAYADWDRNKPKGVKYAHDIVIENLHQGAIILLHAVSPDNMLALESIIKDARVKGFEFGDYEDLIMAP